MEIRWLDDVEIELVDSFDEQQDAINETSMVRFAKGDINDVDIIDERKDNVDMQFSDGSMGYSISKKWYEKVKD